MSLLFEQLIPEYNAIVKVKVKLKNILNLGSGWQRIPARDFRARGL